MMWAFLLVLHLMFLWKWPITRILMSTPSWCTFSSIEYMIFIHVVSGNHFLIKSAICFALINSCCIFAGRTCLIFDNSLGWKRSKMFENHLLVWEWCISLHSQKKEEVERELGKEVLWYRFERVERRKVFKINFKKILWFGTKLIPLHSLRENGVIKK